MQQNQSTISVMPASPAKQTFAAELVDAPREPLWPRVGWWNHLIVSVILACVIGGSFSNSYQSGMVLDNKYIIEEYYKTVMQLDPRHRPDSFYQVALFFRNDYWWPKGISGLYRPVTSLTYWVDYIWLTGKAPKTDSRGQPVRDANNVVIPEKTYREMSWLQYINASGTINANSYHTVNLIIHFINALLIYFVALMLIQRVWPAAMVAALFAAHPITTESVTNIIGRADMLAAVAVFGGLLLYVRSTRSSGSWALPWLVALMLLTAVGVFSKESSAALILVMIVYDVTYRWRSGNPEFAGFPRLLLHGVLYLVLAAVMIGVPLAASAISKHYGATEKLETLIRVAIACVASVIGLAAYFILFRQPARIRIAALAVATLSIGLGAVFLPYYAILPAIAILIIELIRGNLTSADNRYRVVAHSTLYLALFFGILALAFAGIWAADHWWYDEWFMDSLALQDYVYKVMTPLWIRYALASVVFAAGLFIHFFTTRRNLTLRLIGLGLALGASVILGMWTYWMGMLLAIIVAIHEMILGSFVPRSETYRRDWGMIWNRFALGYLVTIPPLIAMFLTRRWVFRNSTPAEEPFLDNPIRGIWKVAELNIPSFAEELARKPLNGVSFFECKMTAVKVMGKLLYLLSWPRTLCSDYSYSQIPNFSIGFHNGFEDVKAIVALVAMIAVFVVVPILAYRRSKPLFFLVLFFFAAALPTSNLTITIGSVMAERFMYLPLAGFTGVVVLAVYAGIRKLFDLLKLNNPDDFQWAPLVAALVLPIIVGIYGVRAYDRNFAWKNDYTLWKDAIATNPLSFRSHQSYAFAIFERYMEALQQNRTPEELEPMLDEMIAIDESARPLVDPLPNHLNSSRLYLHLGMYYTRKAETQSKVGPNGQRIHTPASNEWLHKAIEAVEYGIQVDRSFNEVNRARALRRGDKLVNIFDAGLPALYNLVGNAYAELGEYDKAYRRYLYARHLEPKDGDSYYAIARLKTRLGRYDEASQALLQGLLIAPDRQDFWELLVALYNNRGPAAANAIIQNGNRLQVNLGANQLVQEDMLTAYRDLIRVMRRSLRWDLARSYREQAVNLHKYPVEAIDPIFNEPIEVVTPDGIQFNQILKLD